LNLWQICNSIQKFCLPFYWHFLLTFILIFLLTFFTDLFTDFFTDIFYWPSYWLFNFISLKIMSLLNRTPYSFTPFFGFCGLLINSMIIIYIVRMIRTDFFQDCKTQNRQYKTSTENLLKYYWTIQKFCFKKWKILIKIIQLVKNAFSSLAYFLIINQIFKI